MRWHSKCPRCEGLVIINKDMVSMGGGARKVDFIQCLICGWEKYLDRNVKAQVLELSRTQRTKTYGQISSVVGVKINEVKEWVGA